MADLAGHDNDIVFISAAHFIEVFDISDKIKTEALKGAKDEYHGHSQVLIKQGQDWYTHDLIERRPVLDREAVTSREKRNQLYLHEHPKRIPLIYPPDCGNDWALIAAIVHFALQLLNSSIPETWDDRESTGQNKRQA